MQKKAVAESNNIRVVCRCRPLNKLEMEQGGEQCVTIIDDTNISVSVAGEEHPHKFSFDKIFASNTRQVDVFHEVGEPVLNSIMSGINATVFAYGQTSSGKTHTMEGKHDDPEYKGLIPRMMERLFEMITEAPGNLEFTIKASFLEIYNEKIHDLLDTSKTNLSVKEDKLRGIVVHDATEACVVKAADMMKVMAKGSENRSVAATRMNERSSRSHSIFLLTLLQKNTETETSRSSKLYFVDLAGSEKIAKTNVTGQQLEEAKNINKSLTCLGIVINSLSEKKDHIPYRDSKLTRILQESIGGNSKTTLIIACSMCSYNDKETVGTLRFGQRAKSIKNTAKVNEERSAKELMLLLAKAENVIKYKDEVIAALNLQLTAEGGTPHVEKNQAQIEESLISGKVIESNNSNNNSNNNNTNMNNNNPNSSGNTINQNGQVEEIESPPVKKVVLIPKQNNTAQTSRKLLEQHLEIIRQKELIEKLTEEKSDLEIDLANKTSDLQSANDKCKSLAEALDKTYRETELQFEKYYDQVDHLQNEASQRASFTRELKKYTSRLSADLSFILMSEEIDEIDTKFIESNGNTEVSADRQVSTTIRKTLDSIDALSAYISQFEEVQTTHAITEGSDSSVPDHHRKLKTVGDEDNNYKQKKRRDPSKMFSSPRLKQQQHHNSSSGMIRMQRVTSDYHEILSTDGADEFLLTDDSLPPLSSIGNLNAKFILEEGIEEELEDDSSRIEDEEDIKAIIEMTASLGIPDDSAKQDLQTFLISLKRQVRNLTAQNQEFNLTIESMQSCSEGIGSKYKKRLSEIKRVLTSKIKEQEIKYTNLSQRYNEKLIENKNLTLKHEKEIIDKNQSYITLKVDFDNLKKVIQSNHPVSRIAELQQKVKELAGDRQKMFNDLYLVRRDLDEKEVLLKEQEAVIILLKKQVTATSNGSSLTSSKLLQQNQGNSDSGSAIPSAGTLPFPSAKSVPSEFSSLKTNGAEVIYSSRAAVLVDRKDLTGSNGKDKAKAISLKAQIAPSIRGGGGDKSSFQKNNQYLLGDDDSDFFTSNLVVDSLTAAPTAAINVTATSSAAAAGVMSTPVRNSQTVGAAEKSNQISSQGNVATPFIGVQGQIGGVKDQNEKYLVIPVSSKKKYLNQREEDEEMEKEFTRIEMQNREGLRNFGLFGSKSSNKADSDRLTRSRTLKSNSSTSNVNSNLNNSFNNSSSTTTSSSSNSSSIFGAMRKFFM